jgi:protein involved in polysaccharide export with SLBB domain
MTSYDQPFARHLSFAADSRRRLDRVIRLGILFSAFVAVASMPDAAGGQGVAGLLTSRDDLSAAAIKAEGSGNPVQAAAIRQRLRDGDFQVGDRIVLTIFSDMAHSDTLVVREGRVVDLPGKAVLPLTGVLRSELKDRVTEEVLKYVKAVQVDAIPLTRIGVLGEVARPGYFALRSDIPITDGIMLAGGPTASADIEHTVVKRAGREYRSAQETRQAIARGLTFDQFGLNAGDELVVGRQRQLINPSVTAIVGMAASLAAVFVVLHHR